MESKNEFQLTSWHKRQLFKLATEWCGGFGQGVAYELLVSDIDEVDAHHVDVSNSGVYFEDADKYPGTACPASLFIGRERIEARTCGGHYLIIKTDGDGTVESDYTPDSNFWQKQGEPKLYPKTAELYFW